jgi:hypothetical protein
MARLFIVRICVMALCRDTATVEAGKADVYSLRVVLQTERGITGGMRPDYDFGLRPHLVIKTLGAFFTVD